MAGERGVLVLAADDGTTSPGAALHRPLDRRSTLGLGFPPTFGGPFRYLDLIGAQRFLNDMKKFEDRYGERFKVATIIEDYAKENKKFHD